MNIQSNFIGPHPRVETILNMLSDSPWPITIHRHADLPVPIHSPDNFAKALGYEVERIAKTLLLRPSLQLRTKQAKSKQCQPDALTALACNRRLNMRPTAQVLGWT